MRLHNQIEIDEFKKAIDACVGDVWLESIYGDKFNLKSFLSCYVAMAELLKDRSDCLELFCANHADEKHFFKFFDEFPNTLGD